MVEWITDTIYSLGYVGIGFLMFLENLFPPIPSELIMPLAGFVVQQGKMDMGLVLLAGVLGTILGAFPWYYAGKLWGEERLIQICDRHGKWLGLSGADIIKAKNWFERYGNGAVFLGRLVPGVRTLISVPAGLSSMNLVPFLIYSTIGTTIWVVILTYAGFILGENYKLVENYIDPISKIVVIGIGVAVLGFIGYKLFSQRSANKTK